MAKTIVMRSVIEVLDATEVEACVAKVREDGKTDLNVTFRSANAAGDGIEPHRLSFPFPTSDSAKQAARAVKALGNAVTVVEVINRETGRSLSF